MPGGTEVIPGRGRVYRQIDVLNYRDMLVIIRDTMQYMIDQKMTLDQIKAAAPTKGWDSQYGATTGPWTTNDFVDGFVARNDVGDDHRRTFGGEPLGADAPKTRCCSCDDGDFASETTHVPQGS